MSQPVNIKDPISAGKGVIFTVPERVEVQRHPENDAYVFVGDRIVPWSAKRVFGGYDEEGVAKLIIDGQEYVVFEDVRRMLDVQNENVDGPNCHMAALTAMGYEHLGGTYAQYNEILYYLNRDFRPVRGRPSAGEIVFYSLRNDSFHSLFILGGSGREKRQFNKGGFRKEDPYTIDPFPTSTHKGVRKNYYSRHFDKEYEIGGAPFPSALKPLYQYHLLNHAYIFGLRPMNPEWMSVTSNAAYLLDEFLYNRSYIEFLSYKDYLKFDPSFSEVHLRTLSLSDQLAFLYEKNRYERLKDFRTRQRQLMDGYGSREDFHAALRRDILVYLISLGMPADKLSPALNEIFNTLAGRADMRWARHHLEKKFVKKNKRVYSFMGKVAAAYGARPEGYTLQRPADDGEGFVKLSPLDIFRGPDHVTELLGGNDDRRTRLVPLEHPLVMDGAMLLVNRGYELDVQNDGDIMEAGGLADVVNAVRTAKARFAGMARRK